MKKFVLAIIVSFIAMGTQAQVGEKGKLYLDASGGIGVYKNFYTYKDGGLTIYDNEEDTVATAFNTIGLEYGLANWVSLGVNFKGGRYLEDNANKDNKFRVFEISSHFYFLNKDKFTLFGNATLGTSSLVENGRFFWNSNYEARFSGAHTSLGFGFKWLFIKEKVGLFFNYEFNRYFLDLKKYTVDNDNRDLSDVTWTYDVNGHELKLGISVKF